MLWKGSVLFKHVLQGVCIWAAWFVALSRIFDNMHHSTDVLAGGVIGTFWALFVVGFFKYIYVNIKIVNYCNFLEQQFLVQY